MCMDLVLENGEPEVRNFGKPMLCFKAVDHEHRNLFYPAATHGKELKDGVVLVADPTVDIGLLRTAEGHHVLATYEGAIYYADGIDSLCAVVVPVLIWGMCIRFYWEGYFGWAAEFITMAPEFYKKY